jgi:hypothetical protein
MSKVPSLNYQRVIKALRRDGWIIKSRVEKTIVGGEIRFSVDNGSIGSPSDSASSLQARAESRD